jgi:regulator of sirC expression with transglutaminase-like and TPR domain
MDTDDFAELTFAEVVARPEEELNLALAALLFAREEYPDLNPARYLRQLDFLAYLVQQEMRGERHPARDVQLLNRVLFEEEGFVGNQEDYHNPRNSFLNEVLDRRIGLPVSLSIVYLEVGWRLQMPLEGVGMPHHFLVRYAAEEEFFIDPFHQGEILDEQGCRRRLEEASGRKAKFSRKMLPPASKKQTLIRMLNNLKHLYFHRDDFARAIRSTEQILLVEPNVPAELLDLGFLHYQNHDLRQSLLCFQTYLILAPDTPEAEVVRHNIGVLLQMLHDEDRGR